MKFNNYKKFQRLDRSKRLVSIPMFDPKSQKFWQKRTTSAWQSLSEISEGRGRRYYRLLVGAKGREAGPGQ